MLRKFTGDGELSACNTQRRGFKTAKKAVHTSSFLGLWREVPATLPLVIDAKAEHLTLVGKGQSMCLAQSHSIHMDISKICNQPCWVGEGQN